MGSGKEITLEDFLKLLFTKFSFVVKEVSFENISLFAKYGHFRGWLEDLDENNLQQFLDKRTAARIIHQFMKIELKMMDKEDISGANVLKDLYTCRVCVNHVAQVFVQKVMDAETVVFEDEEVLIFNMNRLVLEVEVKKILEVLSEKYSTGVLRKEHEQ